MWIASPRLRGVKNDCEKTPRGVAKRKTIVENLAKALGNEKQSWKTSPRFFEPKNGRENFAGDFLKIFTVEKIFPKAPGRKKRRKNFPHHFLNSSTIVKLFPTIFWVFPRPWKFCQRLFENFHDREKSPHDFLNFFTIVKNFSEWLADFLGCFKTCGRVAERFSAV